MNCVYFVMSGAVEILRSATQEDVERELSGNTSIEHSFTVDIDESLMLDCSVIGDGMMPIGAVNGRLHIDRLKVCVLIQHSSTAAVQVLPWLCAATTVRVQRLFRSSGPSSL
jgi:hypothetical protein